MALASVIVFSDPVHVILVGRIQNAVSAATWENLFNAEIVFHIEAKMRFGQSKNLSDVAVLLRSTAFSIHGSLCGNICCWRCCILLLGST